jgi:hypothetical protein
MRLPVTPVQAFFMRRTYVAADQRLRLHRERIPASRYTCPKPFLQDIVIFPARVGVQSPQNGSFAHTVPQFTPRSRFYHCGRAWICDSAAATRRAEDTTLSRPEDHGSKCPH